LPTRNSSIPSMSALENFCGLSEWYLTKHATCIPVNRKFSFRVKL
jgi:hypothetical protein